MFTQSPDTLIELALAAAGGSTFIIFAVALQNFFVQPPILTRPQRLFQDLSVLVGIIHGLCLIGIEPASQGWAGVGIAMYAASLTIFLASIEAARRVPLTRTFVYEPRPDRVVQTGPFRFVRHPLYLAYSLAWLAAPVAMNSALLGLTAAGLIACYAASAVEEERRLLASPLGAEYREYMKATRRLVPFVY